MRQGISGPRSPIFLPQKTHRFIYYSDTGWAVGAEESDFEGWAFPFPGVTLIEDFVTREEEAEMVQLMDREPWKLSQSGRRKQVGPARSWEEGRAGLAGQRGVTLPGPSRLLAPRPFAHVPPSASLGSHSPPGPLGGRAPLTLGLGQPGEWCVVCGGGLPVPWACATSPPDTRRGEAGPYDRLMLSSEGF